MRGLAEDDKRAFLSRRLTPGISIVAIAIVSVAIMMVDNANSSLSPIRSTLSVATQPIQVAAEMPGEIVHYLGQYFDRGRLISENEALEQKVLLLQARLQRLASLQAENERIRALLASASSLDQNVLIARILSVSPDPYRHTIKLNKGSSDGVFVGQALVDANGVLGQVTDVTPLDSHAILITDVNHGVPVEINRTGLQTIAQGSGKSDELRLPFLANNADIRADDLLVTSGLGGRYPAGYPVAHVREVRHEPGNEFLDITADPTANLNRGREVLLVWTSNTEAQARADDAATDADSSNDGEAGAESTPP